MRTNQSKPAADTHARTNASTSRTVWCVSLLAMAAVPAVASGQTIYWSRSGTNIPYSSAWDETAGAWGAATALPTLAADGYWLQAARPRSGSEIALGATNSAKAATIMFNTTGTFAAPTTLQADTGLTTWRRFSVAYGQSSGACLMVWTIPSPFNVYYQTATGGALSSAATVMTTSDIPEWVRLYPKPASNEVLLMVSDNSDQLYANVWSGTAWGGATSFGSTNSSHRECFGAVYQSTSGTALAVYPVGSSSTPSYRTYASGSWSAASTMTACSGQPEWVRLAAKPGSNEVVCGILDANKHLRMYIWDGSTWTSSVEICTNLWATDRRSFDVAYQPDGQNALVVYSQNSTAPAFRTYDGASWSAAASMTDWGGNPAQNKPSFVQVVPGKSGGEVFVVASTSNTRDLKAWRWSGTAFGSMTTLETSLGGTNITENFWLLGSKKSVTIKSWQQVDPNP